MNYNALYSYVQNQTGDTTATALIYIQLYLNMAAREVAGEFDNWLEEEATTSFSTIQGTEKYTFSSMTPAATDFFRMRKLYNSTSGYEGAIEQVNYGQFRNVYDATSTYSQSLPNRWYFTPGSAVSINLFPIPDKVYTITMDYIKAPADMVLDTDTPFFPARWHHILTDYALSKYYESPTNQDFEKANYYYTRFQNSIDLMRADISKRNLNTLPFIYGTGVNEGTNGFSGIGTLY